MFALAALSAVAAVTAFPQPEIFEYSVKNAQGKEFHTTMEVNQPTICDPDVQQYSGYLNAGGINKYFFWFFESRSAPSEAPFIMWLTGGPGCSSQLAMIVENGPCRVINDGTATELNPYSWNNVSNIMWVDQPPQTGFSTGKTVTTEEEIAEDMWAFLQNFIKQFPQYFKNGFYVVGESYGGHYVPNVMSYIYKQNKAGAGTRIPLKGFGIGNGLTDPYVQFAYYAEMAYNSTSAVSSNYSGIPISTNLYQSMKSKIPTCQSEILKCNQNPTNKQQCDSAYQYCMSNEVQPVTNTGVNPYNLDIKCQIPGLCYDFSAETKWLNNATVQRQIGVNMQWQSCNTLVNIRLESDWMKNYQQEIIEPIENGVRALIYAGDLDFICNWLGNQAWTLALPWAGQTAFNQAQPVSFMVGNEAVGTLRQGQGNSNLTFVRVYRAGHMVPMDAPSASLGLISRFLKDTL